MVDWQKLIKEEGARYAIQAAFVTIGAIILGWFENVPWTIRIPAALVTIVALFALYDRAKGLFPQWLGQARGQQPSQTTSSNEDGVRFYLPGGWETPISRVTIADKQPGPAVPAEEIRLRLMATRNLQNVRVKIKIFADEIFRTRSQVTELTLADEFVGVVPKGMRKDVVIMHRRFRMIKLPHDGKEAETRIELGLEFFPETNAPANSSWYGDYIVSVEAFHEEGPDAASFTINTAVQNRPLTIVAGRHNVELVSEQR